MEAGYQAAFTKQGVRRILSGMCMAVYLQRFKYEYTVSRDT